MELHLHCSCRIKSSFGLSVFWLASWTGRYPWLLVLLQCSPLPASFTLLPKKGQAHKCIHIYTQGPSGVFVFLFVSICSESGTWHLWGGQASPTRPPGLSHVWMQTSTHHGKLIKSVAQCLNYTVQNASLLLIIFIHKHTQEITAWNHMNIPPLHLLNIPENIFFPLVFSWNWNSLQVKLDAFCCRL